MNWVDARCARGAYCVLETALGHVDAASLGKRGLTIENEVDDEAS